MMEAAPAISAALPWAPDMPPRPADTNRAAGQVAVLGDAQLQTAGVEQGVEGAVDDALGPDVHPAAGGHLAVVGDAQGGGAVEGFFWSSKVPTIRPLVMMTRGARSCGLWNRPRGWPDFDDEGLVVGEDLEVLLDQAVLHPVLADLAGLAVGGQLIGVEGDVEVEVVVDHDLDGPALDAGALVLVDGLAVELPPAGRKR